MSNASISDARSCRANDAADHTPNATAGKTFKESLIQWNYEQKTHSSAFGGTGKDDGRDIDIVAEPKILIRSGLIK